MAEDTSLGNQTVVSFLLETITGEWRNNREAYGSPGDLMRTCLLKAGVSYLGPQALQIHMALFRYLFIENENVIPAVVPELGFCVRDYFELLQDEQLGWMSFLTKVLPHLRLNKANNFLEKLSLFVRGFDGKSQSADIQLLLFALSLVHNIVLDFLLAARGGTDASREVQDGAVDSLPMERLFNPHDHLHSDAQIMATHLRTFVESLLQLCSVDKLCYLVSLNMNLFQQLVENLILAVAILNPYSTVKDTSSLLLDGYVGQVFIPDINKRRNNNTKNKKDLNRSAESRGGSFSTNFVWTEIVLKQPKSRLENVEHETSAEKAVTVDGASNDEITFSTFNILINSVLSHIPSTLFIDLICWFCQSDAENKDFYKPLSNILYECKDIFVGHHVLSGRILYPWFMKFQQDFVKGLLVPIQNAAELQTAIALCLLPGRIYDLSRFRMSEIDFILESGRELAGHDDMDLLRKAVFNKESRWKELLEMGMTNTDISGWWRAGFFQLMWDNEATLSSERNVRQILQILCRVAVECHSPGDAEFRNSVIRLFGIMFKRLPTLLQEQVVLSTLIPPSHGVPDPGLITSGLHHLLSQGEVIEQLTPLLNRLTSAGVDKMVGHILFLCLFDANVVIQKALKVAIENKAQVLPVVEVLRRMSGICCCSESKSNQSKLLYGLDEILSDTVINDNKADNIIQILCMCTERYSLEIVVNRETNITKNMSGLLSQSDIFQHFICPSLDCESFPEVTARQQQECISEHPGNSSKEGQDQDLNRKTESDRETDMCRKKDEVAEDKPDTHSGFVSGGRDSEVIHLPIDVSLRALSALLESVDSLGIVALKPFPLLVILADLYARNCIVFQNGDLDKRMLLIKQASQKSIALLTSAIWKYCSIFTKADFLWLKQHALKCGWLYIAVLKPVLNIGCDVELHDILSSFTSQLMLQDNSGSNIKGLVVLIQLALINDEMLSDLMSVIKQSHLSAGHSQLVLALGCILASSLTTEMYRLVNIIIMLLANQDKPVPIDNDLLVQDVSSDVFLRIQASQLLTDAVLQLSTSELTAAPWCHIVSNYQTAEQSLLQQKEPTFILLVDVFCHCCTVLSVTDDQAAHLLQVSAMDILTKLRACMSITTEDQSDVVKGKEERVEHDKGLCVIGGYIECVCEDSVKVTLRAQLANVI